MMASSSSSTSPYKREREDQSSADEQHGPPSQPASSKWRTSRAQEAYSSKLLDALRLVRAGGTASSPARGREVRDAADRALAAAARGRSRWSRAIILSSRRRRRRRSASATLLRAPITVVPGGGRSSSSSFSSVVVVERKAKVLGRLVPGCRGKLPFPALLAEVSDYIAALEMQVRSMNAVAQALSSSS